MTGVVPRDLGPGPSWPPLAPAAPVVPRDLGPGELDDPGLRGLLRLATDYDETALTRLVVEELPALVVLAVFDDDGPAAMAAYRAPAPGPGPAPAVVIEYLATAPAHQRRGLAGALIAEIRRRHPDAVVRASTDDDAIGFYRGLGFLDSPAPVDPRWPGRRRYDCALPPSSSH